MAALAGCTPPKPLTRHVVPNLQPRLSAADALVRIGCFDCLTDALREYEAIRAVEAVPAQVADAATAGAIRTATILDLRERELGMADDGYLQRARNLASGRADLPDLSFAFDIVEIIPWKMVRSAAAPSAALSLEAVRRLSANHEAWTERLRSTADRDPLWASLWLSFACTHGTTRVDRNALIAPFAQLRDAPLVTFQTATCIRVDAKAIAELMQTEPRYAEAAYSLGLAAIGARHLDEAETHLTRAYGWHPRWPAAAVALANVYMTAEELQAALDFYSRALTIAPGH